MQFSLIDSLWVRLRLLPFLVVFGLLPGLQAVGAEKKLIDILDLYPDLHRVAAQSANWDQNEAFQKTQTLLQRYPNIKGLISGNDTMALGAEAALRAAGKNEVIVVGFDGIPDAAESVKTGQIKATVLQPIVKLAETAVEEADIYLQTGKTDK